MKRLCSLMMSCAVLLALLVIGAQAQEVQRPKRTPAPVNSGIANIGIMFTKLTVDPVLDAQGNRYAHLEMRNVGSQPVRYAQYFLKYWWRAEVSDDWQYKNSSSFQTPLNPHQTGRMDIPVGPLTGATEFRVTLHENRQSPIIIEISTPVEDITEKPRKARPVEMPRATSKRDQVSVTGYGDDPGEETQERPNPMGKDASQAINPLHDPVRSPK